MLPKTNIRSIKFILRLASLCALLTIAACNKQCKPRLPHAAYPFKLKSVSKHLTGQNPTISFKVVKNKLHPEDSPVADNLFLRLTRKEGKSATIKGGGVRELESGLFEYTVSQIGDVIEALQIEVEEDEQRAVFELELVYNGIFLGNPKKVEFENKDIRLTINKLTKKLYDEDRFINFTIKNKGKDLPQDGELSVIFIRKEGHQATIEGRGIRSIQGPNGEKNGVFELPINIDPDKTEKKISGLKLHTEEGETRAVFEAHLAYKGTQIGKSKKITWLFKKVNLALKTVTRELRGAEKTIKFFIKRSKKKSLMGILKGKRNKKVYELDGNLLALRITRVLDTNASIEGAEPIGDTKGTYELPLSDKDIESIEPIQSLAIQVDEGDKLAKFKLQLVYDDMNVGKPQFVTWRDADVRLELTDVSKELFGEEEENRKIEFTIINKGKNRPKEDYEENQSTILRIIRLKDTNAEITGEDVEETGSGVWELPIDSNELPADNGDLGTAINKLQVEVKPGDKLAQFHLQLFYEGMEMGKPKLVTWKPNDVRLELKGVSKKLIGMEDRNIKFTIHNKGKHDLDNNKPLLLRLTRHEGLHANIKLTADKEGFKLKEDNKHRGVFELEIPHENIDNALEILQIKPREGETRVEFKLQLVYDGVAMGKHKTVVWEAEKAQLELAELTEKLRGDNRQIRFTVQNKTKNRDLPELNDLYLRITRKSGYNSEIKETDKLEDKHNGVYELQIDTERDLDRSITDLTIIPRQGETKAEFKLQLVYKGLNIGKARKVVWVEKDIQLHLTKLTTKLRGDNKQINFTIANKGKDDPESDKLFIRFTRDKGHLATISREGNSMEETSSGSYEFKIDSKHINNQILDFKIEPREGERKAQFKAQLIYDGKDMGKAETITWTEKIIGLSIKDLTSVLRGHGDENTTIKFTIHRTRQGKSQENELEDKLLIRFKRKKGLATITNTQGRDMKESSPGIFECTIDKIHIGNEIKNFKIVPGNFDKETIFAIELVYHGKTVGKAKKIKWTTEDIRPELHLEKHRIEMNEATKAGIISFTVKNEGKDSLKEENRLVVRFKRKKGTNSTIQFNKTSGNTSTRFQEKHGFFEYELDNNKLNSRIEELEIYTSKQDQLAKFEMQLFLDEVPVGKPQKIVGENTTEKERIAQEKKEEAARKKLERREEKRKKQEEKRRMQAEQESQED